MVNRSNFPNAVDQFSTIVNVLSSDKTNVQRYQTLLMQETRTTEEETELTNLKNTLINKIITSEHFNFIQDSITNMQSYYLNDVVAHLATLDVGALRADVGYATELQTANKVVVAAINEVNQAKNSLQTGMGDVTDLQTVDKTNVVDAINEVNAFAKNALPKTGGDVTGQTNRNVTTSVFEKVQVPDNATRSTRFESPTKEHISVIRDAVNGKAIEIYRESINGFIGASLFSLGTNGIYNSPLNPTLVLKDTGFSTQEVTSGSNQKMISFAIETNVNSGWDTANNKIIIPSSGVYLFNGYVNFGSTEVVIGKQYQLKIAVNGIIQYEPIGVLTPSVTQQSEITGSIVHKLTTNDVVEFYVYHNAGVVNSLRKVRLTMAKIS